METGDLAPQADSDFSLRQAARVGSDDIELASNMFPSPRGREDWTIPSPMPRPFVVVAFDEEMGNGQADR